eukprot:CAMPEP_0201709204 /NCGR_PEP_ID=MMETSP0578-20130828/57974_1 /ASSEMBLY_ACC=CAM_ASM_000663 /TAXON_ID=267565 /ORGANISM="Skeletonema grethea, Strain CCMP 1804" /LENGTH=456 /DNA_ID=CAMNT_0048198159 /DNA_START=69 /DNA_END=1439 /DNA_ORIENTATION=-
MDKFLSNLRGEGDKNKKDASKKGSNDKQWRGGSSDMDAIKKKNASAASKVGNAVKEGTTKKGDNNVFGKGINEALGKIDLFNNNKQNKNARGGGARLGGTLPGRVISISLDESGALGIEVEKRKNSEKTAIISRVITGSQAERAGLQRGDIVCHVGGQEEYPYKQFVALAKSGKRPLRFDIRRIESSVLGGNNKSTIANSGKNVSADAQLRKQAVIAAAEAREAKFKAKTAPKPKSVPKSTSTDKVHHHLHTTDVEDSEETKRAIEASKQAERDDAEKLGYNPYEARAMTSGQARTATVAMTTGTISATNAPSKISGDTASPGRTNAPSDPGDASVSLDPAFEHAFQTLVTSNAEHNAVLKSMKIMRTLITNATTKGQQGGDETSSKFRRVRLSNPKIREAITDMNGALELMMCVGFVLSENEDDGETYLVYPPGDTGPDWLKSGIARMEGYEKAK